MKGYGRHKTGGFVGNLSKLGGSKKKLSLKTDMQNENMSAGNLKHGQKQAHKRA
jgi:hypothetical protein